MVDFLTVVLIINICLLPFAGFLDSRRNKMNLANKYNKLYMCSECLRYSRHYQIDLAKASKVVTGWVGCPHCETSEGQFQVIKNEDKWMESHPDCLKIPYKEINRIDNLISSIKQTKKEDQETQRFLDYNKLAKDVSWIENLHKELTVNEIQVDERVNNILRVEDNLADNHVAFRK